MRLSWLSCTAVLSKVPVSFMYALPPQTGAKPAPKGGMVMLKFSISIVVTAEAVALILFFLLRFCG